MKSSNKRVIVLTPKGEAITIYDREKRLDLSILGSQKIDRASDIIWNEANQKWSIKMLQGDEAGKILSEGDDTILFDEYSEAVSYEIKYINSKFLCKGML